MPIATANGEFAEFIKIRPRGAVRRRAFCARRWLGASLLAPSIYQYHPPSLIVLSDTAEASFSKAIAVAQHQNAKIWELVQQ
jgi:hypothetical protein